ncbi:polysaccharide deacetylase familiy protein [Streptomyces sulfonofaciens]|uniref:Polysaccharide deacetylase familiy protein n=1 Tax=Streptomyces sulfonofaciens TaxID=68272 RepID=A0A919L809_9ACTN|nr:polysaccharide deacetylase family protein [Streptomyces sulfonofaciens]GHH86784.1 polysaccharide deacetylase familiy protein [Streptomyces sulfonofaciens]
MTAGRGRRHPRAQAALTAGPALVLAAHVAPAGTWLPWVRRALWPSLAGLGERGHVALTFDDGPDPGSTPYFLDALERLSVRATFFVLGEEVRRHQELARETARRGHELAVHGWDHSPPWLPAPGRDVRDLGRARAVVGRASGAAPRWYRPPYGILTGGRWAAARRCGLRPVLWTSWGRDWTADAAPAAVLAAVRRNLRGGGTVLLHDTDRTAAPGAWRATLAMLPELVGHCRAAGLSVGPLAEHGIDGHGPAPDGHR